MWLSVVKGWDEEYTPIWSLNSFVLLYFFTNSRQSTQKKKKGLSRLRFFLPVILFLNKSRLKTQGYRKSSI